MNKHDEQADAAKDELLVSKAKSLFDDSVDSIDAATQSRLNRARQKALAKSRRSGLGIPMQWLPAAGLATAVALAVVMWNGAGDSAIDAEMLQPIATAQVGDFEILMNDDSLDMLQDLEFYSWVEIDEASDIESDVDANVG